MRPLIVEHVLNQELEQRNLVKGRMLYDPERGQYVTVQTPVALFCWLER